MGNVFPFRRQGPWDRPARPHVPHVEWKRRHGRQSGLRGHLGRAAQKLVPIYFAFGVVLLAIAAYDRLGNGALDSLLSEGREIFDRQFARRDDNPVVPSPTPASATAIDGDSLRYRGVEIRLLGIDAPEYRQTCRDERGREWACGREARAQLERLLSRGPAKCLSNGKDRYGRTLARCSASDIADVGEAMVRAGYAIDFMGGGYSATEAEARRNRRGIWRGQFERPADWRRANPRTAQSN